MKRNGPVAIEVAAVSMSLPPQQEPAPSGQEPAQGTSASTPLRTRKVLWIVLAAVIIVAILLLSFVPPMPLSAMQVSIIQDELSVDAGKALSVSVTVKKGFRNITDSDDVRYLWTLVPEGLGGLQDENEPTARLIAGKAGGSGQVSCRVTYKGEESTVTKSVTVRPPYLDSVLVSPGTKTIGAQQTNAFSAFAVNSVGDSIPNLVFVWSLSGDVAVDCELSGMVGGSVQFTSGSAYGNVTLTATATYENVTKSGNASIVIGPPPLRSIDYRWYDMFNVPFGEWWDMRATYNNFELLSDEYPYLFEYRSYPEGNNKTYSNMRLNITGSNMTEINMNERPEFLPLHGNVGGGTAVIDWYLQYPTKHELEARLPFGPVPTDGWAVSLNGTVSLDEQAALSVLLDLTSEGFDDFSAWWGSHADSVKDDFSDWFDNEAGKDRLDIFPMYDYEFTTIWWDLDAEKVGDCIVLHYDHISWGMEALMTRWLHEAFMPTEWWFEDMDFHATIGPEYCALQIDTAVAFAVRAWESVDSPGEPCWVWEAKLGDCIEAFPPEHKESDFNLYADKHYSCWSPGSELYGQSIPYEYTPGAWNLTDGESLRFEWPGGDQIFRVHIESGEVYNDTAGMVSNYSEPFSSDQDALYPGSFSMDYGTDEMVFSGPIDMWHWSRLQDETSHTNLTEEWDRLLLLPRGVPYIEFGSCVFTRLCLQETSAADSLIEIGVPDSTGPGARSSPLGDDDAICIQHSVVSHSIVADSASATVVLDGMTTFDSLAHSNLIAVRRSGASKEIPWSC